MIEIINKPLFLHLVGYLYYWQMGFNSVFKGLISYNCAHHSSIWMAPCEALLGTAPEVGTLPKDVLDTVTDDESLKMLWRRWTN